MKNIRVTALFEEGNQNKNKCSIKNAALVIIKNSAEEVTYVGYGTVDLAGFTGTT
mgnify:CR=1 FL=1